MERHPLLVEFAALKDPRVKRTRKHRLDDILFLALCAILSGMTSFESIHLFAKCREEWFKTFLTLENGIPSHDTIYRVFCALDRSMFAECFGRWMTKVSATLGFQQIAIDGKSLRGAKDDTFTGCIHLVSAWATEQGLILGQELVASKSNEIAAIPEVLKTLQLKGAIVTIDAAGCQKEIAEAIREKGGDYLLCVKGNQPQLHEAVQQVFTDACAAEFIDVQYTQHSSSESGHGRHEQRYVTVIGSPHGLPEGWRDVAVVVQVNRERQWDGKTSSTTHYYIASRHESAHVMGHLVRKHWSIENELHWVLDVTFGEDGNRTADRNASANLGIVRRTAIGLLKQDDSKGSLRNKMHHAALDTAHLERVLRGNMVF